VSIAREENVRSKDVLEEDSPEENDGLTLSAAPHPAIRLEPDSIQRSEAPIQPLRQDEHLEAPAEDPYAHLSWLSSPISGRTFAWLVDGLVMLTAFLLFAFIFLSIAHELPPWPLTVGTAVAAAGFVAVAYRTMFVMFGGRSLGSRLGQSVISIDEKEEGELRGRLR
jgi:hypothetical protein